MDLNLILSAASPTARGWTDVVEESLNAIRRLVR